MTTARERDAGALWAALPLPGLLLDHSGRIEALNAAAELFLNVSNGAARGRALTALMEAEPDLDAAIAGLRANRAPVKMADITLAPAGGARGRADLYIAPSDETSGADLQMLIAPRDLPARLGRWPDTGAAARGLSAMLAHEIKNPLAGITGAAQLLSMSLSEDDRELTGLIVAESRRIVALLEQVERFGDLRAPALASVNIHDVLERARHTAQLGFAADASITSDYDPSLPPALVDADQLQQVVLNLLRNAREAAGAGGRITLRSFFDPAPHRRGPDGTRRALPVQVEVIDNGPGVPEALRETLFDPFVSGREAGTGLGLALVAKIVAAHEALVGLDSRAGRTAFRLSLPRASGEPAGEGG